MTRIEIRERGELGLEEDAARQVGMHEMAEKFRESGADIYQEG